MNASDEKIAKPSQNIDEGNAKLNELESRLTIKITKKRLHMFLFLLVVVLFMTGVFFLLQTELMSNWLTNRSYYDYKENLQQNFNNIRLFGSIFMLLSTVIFSYLYMVGFSPRRHIEDVNHLKSEVADSDFLSIISVLKGIEKSIEKGKIESVLSEKERDDVINKISETVDSQLNDSLLTKIEEKYGHAIHNEKIANLATRYLKETVSRLDKYANDLQSKATVNLSYGIGATIIAIGILIFVVMNASSPPENLGIATAFYYTSRLLLVVLVQGISFFFLNLYKTTLNDILYINNEITNYEAKRDSLALAFRTGSDESVSSMLLLLAQTERNFILKKGETSMLNRNGQTTEQSLSALDINKLLLKILKQN